MDLTVSLPAWVCAGPVYNAGRDVVMSSPWTTGVDGISGGMNLSVRLSSSGWEEQDMVLFARMRICRETIACSVTPLAIPQPDLNIVLLIDASGSVDNSEFGAVASTHTCNPCSVKTPATYPVVRTCGECISR